MSYELSRGELVPVPAPFPNPEPQTEIIEGPIPFGPGDRLRGNGEVYSKLHLYHALGPVFGYWRAPDQRELLPEVFEDVHTHHTRPVPKIDLPITAIPSRELPQSPRQPELTSSTAWAEGRTGQVSELESKPTRLALESVPASGSHLEVIESSKNQKVPLRTRIGRALGALTSSLFKRS